MKTLIAEDEAISRLKLQKQLEQWGHEVVAARDGVEAWSRAVRNYNASLDYRLTLADNWCDIFREQSS